MRRAFLIPLSPATSNAPAFWREMGALDGLKLRHFFEAVVQTHEIRLAKEDGKLWSLLPLKTRQRYQAEAESILFANGAPTSTPPQPLPLAPSHASYARMRQKPNDLANGVNGCHIALLWSQAGRSLLGVAKLEKTAVPAQTNLAFWKAPQTQTDDFRTAVTALMNWSNRTLGTTSFVTHIEAATAGQRGNPPSLLMAQKLGFDITDQRPAGAPNGNGKDILILTRPAP
jgi:hypothetical protein